MAHATAFLVRSSSSTSLPEPTDPPGEFVGDVHVVVEGDRARPAVALIHGIPGSVRDFRYLGPALVDAGLCAVRFDMPGFGKTPAHAFPSTKAPDRAAFVRGVMRALGFDRFAIAGHSFGGGVALLCAALFGDDVRALGCINSVGPRRHQGAASPAFLARVTGDAMSLPIVGDALHRLIVAGVYDARGLKSETGLDKETVVNHSYVIADQHYEHLRAACAAVRCPALVVSSVDDPLVEPASSFALARALAAPTVTHMHSKDGGHFLQKLAARPIARWFALQLR